MWMDFMDDSSLSLKQLVSIPAGNGYHFHADVNITLGGSSTFEPGKQNDNCNMFVNSDGAGTLFSNYYTFEATPSVSLSIDTAGISSSASTWVQIYISCSGNYDMTYSIDNVALSTYSTFTSASGIYPDPVQVLTNNNFWAGATNWTMSSTVTRSSFDASKAQGVVTFGGIDPKYESPTWIQQVTPIIELNQTYSLSADVWAAIPSGTTCTLQFSVGGNSAWYLFQTPIFRDVLKLITK
jgi:hypothetical protein